MKEKSAEAETSGRERGSREVGRKTSSMKLKIKVVITVENLLQITVVIRVSSFRPEPHLYKSTLQGLDSVLNA
jgi:hypothetical protein